MKIPSFPKNLATSNKFALTSLLCLTLSLGIAAASDETTGNDPATGDDTETTESPESAGNESTGENGSSEAAENGEDGEEEWQRLGRGMRYRDIHVGDGESPELWANVFVHYRVYSEYGLLLEDTFAAGNPQRFVIGSGLMPAPLETAVKTMNERGRRELMVPAELFEAEDFQHHADAHGGNLDQVRASLRPGMLLRVELSLMWVRPYDPTERHRFH